MLMVTEQAAGIGNHVWEIALYVCDQGFQSAGA